MEECFRCGITSDETRLFAAIAEEGIVKACRDCINRENLPTVRKPSLDQLKESDERLSVREKLSMMAGIESRRDSSGNREYVKTSSQKGKNEYDLNDIIERNLEKKKLSKKSMEKLPPEKELVENFHWKVMRGRRLKKISQEQLGGEIGESETAINMIENGELPEDFERLIKKLEAYLRIRLFKNPEKKKTTQAEISFDPYSTKNTQVRDLKEKSQGDSESNNEQEDESKESLDNGNYDYPEQNKARRSKLWNLFRKKARKVQNREDGEDMEDDFEYNEDKGQDTYSEKIDSDDLYYEDLEDYDKQEVPGEQKREKPRKERRTGKESKKEEIKKENSEKSEKDKEDLSQKDIDDLIFRKS